MSTQPTTESVAKQIEAARRDLIELTRRNPLINFKSTTGSVQFVHPDPEVIATGILEKTRRFKIMSLAGMRIDNPGRDDSELLSSSGPGTLVSEAPTQELNKTLRLVYKSARESLQETGVQTLYMGFGMLEWYESESSDALIRSPLILCSVELTKENALADFAINGQDEEPMANLALSFRLRSDFDIKLPALVTDPEQPLSFDGYFSAVEESVRAVSRWRVQRDAVVLGTFSFTKLQMYLDLDPATWPQNAGPADHPIIRSLLSDGFNEKPSNFPDGTRIDDRLLGIDTFNVVDADSSQTVALRDALDGRNLIIQGPPGTGKSQTITNLIAESVAAGKRVLFVSEKMAALEVVKRRLDSVGLGDACLELHSNKSNKSAVLAELSRTLSLPKPGNPSPFDAGSLTASRQDLNEYSDAVNAPIGPSGVAPIAAYGHCLAAEAALADAPGGYSSIAEPDMANWTPEYFSRASAALGAVIVSSQAIPSFNENAFWGAGIREIPPSDRDRLSGLIDAAQVTCEQLDDNLNALSDALGRLLGAVSDDPVVSAVTLARHLSVAPDFDPHALRDHAGLTGDRVCREALQAGERCARARAALDSEVASDAWTADVSSLARTLRLYGSSSLGLLRADYRSAKRMALSLRRTSAPRPSDAALVDMLEQILEWQSASAIVSAAEDVGSNAFGSNWHGINSDWATLRRISDWIAQLQQGVADGLLDGRSLGIACRAVEAGALGQFAALTSEIDTSYREWRAGLQQILDYLKYDAANQGEVLNASYPEQKSLLASWDQSRADVVKIMTFNIACDDCSQIEGLASTAETARVWAGTPTHLRALFNKYYYQTLLDAAHRERPVLAKFDAAVHDLAVSRHAKLDTGSLTYNRYRVALAHWERLPRQGGAGQVRVLTHEFNKKRRHMPLRTLLANAGEAIQALKPVFMMSPLSVAAYIAPGTIQFDIVIFDEASQVRPVDAFGAICRAKQAVVVGDSKQLPPTPFFGSDYSSSDEDDEVASADIESILGLFEGQGAPGTMLRWHYRSRHESLIALSNREFYDSKLVTFPSANSSGDTAGVQLRYLPNTYYDRGGSRTNPVEAKSVAEAVIAHATLRPHESLGVAAFSKKQALAIEDELELLRRGHPETDAFFSAHNDEPFFIKNLESVQGDERDSIFISIGYGKDSAGYLSQNFGPLNKDGGWRRLNVIITRAKLRCTVFTNLSSGDISVEPSTPKGVQALATYLRFLETGILDSRQVLAAAGESPFEDAVADRLRAGGYTVHHQVGSGGFRIDLAVVDDSAPGRYLLAIECDGATYHSARSARDRDRLRQDVLEHLGWTVHRIWSTDWFLNQDEQFKRLVDAIELARNAATSDPAPVSTAKSSTISIDDASPNDPPTSSLLAATTHQTLPAASPTESAISVPYSTASATDVGKFIHSVESVCPADITAIVAAEGPIHREVLYRRLATFSGVGRVGSSIRGKFDELTETAVGRGNIEARGDFLWPSGAMTTAIVRDRSALASTEKKIAYITPEELDVAVIGVIERSIQVNHEEATVETARVLGFARCGSDVASAIQARITALVSAGVIAESRGALSAAAKLHG